MGGFGFGKSILNLLGLILHICTQAVFLFLFYITYVIDNWDRDLNWVHELDPTQSKLHEAFKFPAQLPASPFFGAETQESPANLTFVMSGCLGLDLNLDLAWLK